MVSKAPDLLLVKLLEPPLAALGELRPLHTNDAVNFSFRPLSPSSALRMSAAFQFTRRATKFGAFDRWRSKGNFSTRKFPQSMFVKDVAYEGDVPQIVVLCV